MRPNYLKSTGVRELVVGPTLAMVTERTTEQWKKIRLFSGRRNTNVDVNVFY